MFCIEELKVHPKTGLFTYTNNEEYNIIYYVIKSLSKFRRENKIP